jgi:hypothetical protein
VRDHLVARVEEPERGVEERLLAADREQHFGRRDVHTVVTLVAAQIASRSSGMPAAAV